MLLERSKVNLGSPGMLRLLCIVKQCRPFYTNTAPKNKGRRSDFFVEGGGGASRRVAVLCTTTKNRHFMIHSFLNWPHKTSDTFFRTNRSYFSPNLSAILCKKSI